MSVKLHIYLGAYLEIVAPPIMQMLEKTMCPQCNELKSDTYCPKCGTLITSFWVQEKIPATFYGLLELNDQYDTFCDVLFQIPTDQQNNTIYCAGNLAFPDNPDAFTDPDIVEIGSDIPQTYIAAFSENYRDILHYFFGLVEQGHIISMTIKFGCIIYYW